MARYSAGAAAGSSSALGPGTLAGTLSASVTTGPATVCRGPVNHFFADNTHQSQAAPTTTATATIV